MESKYDLGKKNNLEIKLQHTVMNVGNTFGVFKKYNYLGTIKVRIHSRELRKSSATSTSFLLWRCSRGQYFGIVMLRLLEVSNDLNKQNLVCQMTMIYCVNMAYIQ